MVLSFYHFEGSFHFWELLWGLVLRPFYTCSSLMLFSPFSCFLWLLSLLVAFFLSVLLSQGWCEALFFCVWFFLVFCCCCVFLGRIPPSPFLYWFCSQQFAELGSIDFFAFSARACSLAFMCLAILFLGTCRAVFFYILISFPNACFLIYLFLFLTLVLRPFSVYWFCYFSYSEGSFFKFFCFCCCCGSSSTSLFFFLVLFFPVFRI